VFGLCYSNNQPHGSGLMLCKAGSSRQVSVTTFPFSTQPGHGSSHFWRHFALRQAALRNLRPNLLFKPDWLRQPA